MSTRSNVVIKENGQQLVRIYRQCDGYPSGIGDDIKGILNNGEVTIVNGYGSGAAIPHTFNGIGCLAAYLVGALKCATIGGVYLSSAKTADDWVEWEYILSQKGQTLWLEVQDLGDIKNKKTVYAGPLSLFDGKRVEAKGS